MLTVPTPARSITRSRVVVEKLWRVRVVVDRVGQENAEALGHASVSASSIAPASTSRISSSSATVWSPMCPIRTMSFFAGP